MTALAGCFIGAPARPGRNEVEGLNVLRDELSRGRSPVNNLRMPVNLVRPAAAHACSIRGDETPTRSCSACSAAGGGRGFERRLDHRSGTGRALPAPRRPAAAWPRCAAPGWARRSRPAARRPGTALRMFLTPCAASRDGHDPVCGEPLGQCPQHLRQRALPMTTRSAR